MSGGGDLERALAAHRLALRDGAVAFVTPAQYDALRREMERMLDTLDFEVAQYFVVSALARARWANARAGAYVRQR